MPPWEGMEPSWYPPSCPPLLLQDPPRSPGPAPGPEPPAPCLCNQLVPESQPRPQNGGGTTDGGGAILTRVCSRWGRGGGNPRAGGGWDPALWLPQGPSAAASLHLGTSPKLLSLRSWGEWGQAPDLTTLSRGPPKLPRTL